MWRKNRSENWVDLVVVHSSDEYYGADRVIRQVLESAQEVPSLAGIELWLPVDIKIPEDHESIFDNLAGVHVRRTELPIIRRKYLTIRGGWNLFKRLGGQLSRLRASNARVVYLGTSACLLFAPVARLARSEQVVLHIQEIWSGPERFALRFLARFCTKIVCISAAVRSDLPSYLRARSVLIENSTSAPSIVLPLARPERPIRFLIASRWNSWKGHETLLAAWEHVPEGRELVILGGPAPVGISVDVPTMVANLRNQDSVSVVGEVPDIGRYINEADVVLVPSDNEEPFGLIAIEAFARGRPVIASDGGGLSDIVEHGKNGWKFTPRDVRRLANLLSTIDRDDIERFGDAALATYEARYSEERYRREIVGLLSELMQ
jgi:glycosyltransferase involved in cell wall biosynthesis